MNLTVTTVELTQPPDLLHCFDWEMPDGMEPEGIDTRVTVGLLFLLKAPLQLKVTPIF